MKNSAITALMLACLIPATAFAQAPVPVTIDNLSAPKPTSTAWPGKCGSSLHLIMS
ncbi:hypothetical protein QBC99_005960 [Beijerinckia sp. GAS462]|nr:hypothetical protein [Beijerinckia sp. GAS462]SED39751.1 hypothetical protein SAMN05443249_5268 [Beijerinckia sp. 28-YEA-48]